MLNETTTQLIPSTWNNGTCFTQEYIVYWQLKPHYDQAIQSRQVDKKIAYVCRHIYGG
jgi:hypothetical protein